MTDTGDGGHGSDAGPTPLSPDLLTGLRALIVDLDGVVTDTAELHRRAWKRMFDEYLEQRRGQEAEPFTARDYRRYVDGKPRYDGAASFLAARDIDLPHGDPDDPPDRETVCGLGNRKNRYFRELLDEGGARVIEGSAAWLREARRRGYRLGVVTSSRNGARVVEAVGLSDLFDVRIDGQVGHDRGLAGKPDPAYFLAAAHALSVEPSEAAIAEDAKAGVEAGRRGGFAVVIGVVGDGEPERLLEAGADFVVERLADVPLARPNEDPDE